jgi:thiol-disulfide isomerase/thioredoxin
MKIYILSAVLMAFIVVSCDIVEAPYTKNNIIEPTDTTKRKVLLEDFTGFRCGNCPEASHVAEQIQAVYPDNVIVVSLHAGPLSVPTPVRKYDFRTSETGELANYYGLIATPYGLINRKQFNNQALQSPTAWGGYVAELVQTDAQLKLMLDASYNNVNREISLDVKIDYLQNSSLNHFLAVYIIEDSVVQYQQDDRNFPNVHVPDYVHNHVMRGSFNGTWGEQISPSVIEAGKSLNLPLKYTIQQSKDWRPEKLSLVVFVHNNDTKEILQVEKVSLFK